MELRVESSGAAIDKLSRFLSWVGSPDAQSKLHHAASLAMHKGVLRAFREERDPNDGRPWKKSLRARAEGGKTLRDTSRLVSSIYRTHGVREAKVATRVWYAQVHQEGRVIVPKTKKALRFMVPGGAWVTVKRVVIPRRRFMPEGALPPRFKADITENMRKVIDTYRRRS